MNFLHPSALAWLLPAAGLPALIHLLSRRGARRLRFSDLTLLAAVEARFRPRSRLREALLLVARALLLIALVLAAAGPVDRAAAGAAGEGLDLVLLLDASYSMRAREGATTRFERAGEAGRGLLRRLAPGDRVAFGVFDQELRRPLAWSDAAAADEALSRAVAGLRGTNVAEGLKAARDLLARSPRGRRRATVVLGDGAAHMLAEPPPVPAEGEIVLGLRFPPLANAWVAQARAAVDSSARLPRLEARAGAAGDAARTTLDLWIGERRAGSAALVIPPGAEARATLALPPAADPLAPAWSGRVALRADALAEDDEIFFSVRHRAAPRVLVLSFDSQFERAGRAGWYLRQLFGGAEGTLAGREADFLEAARWAEADLARYGTVLLLDAARPPEGLSAALERFAARGGGIWLAPGRAASAADLAPFSAWLPARLGPPEETSVARGLRVLRAGPETRDWERFELSRVAIGRRFGLEPGPQARVWLADAAGAPLLAQGRVGRGRAAVWAVPLDAEWTNLGLKPLFVPWAKACLSLTLPEEEEFAPSSAHVGDPLARTWGPEEPAPDRVVVRAPDGRRTTLAVRARRAELPSAPLPGLYVFEEPGGQGRVFAVNLDSARGESDLTPAASPPWIEAAPDALEDAFSAAVYGRDRRGWCLALAALALGAEMLLSLPFRTALALALTLFAVLLRGEAAAQQGDRFVWTQLQLGPQWDPYPDAPALISARLAEVTSARVAPERRVISLSSPELFASPFLYLAGGEAPPALEEGQLRRLRQYLAGGGFLWIEDSSGGPPGSFDRWARATLSQVMPEAELKPLTADHVLYRTFFLLRGSSGRVRVSGALEGLNWGGREAVVYSRDDVLGAWALDALGRPLRPCLPDGEPQRELARRLAIDILMYSMTGSYKSDAVHQAAILDKLRRK